ncbi:FAD-dependent oxidoreductase [Phaeobacter italicus]|uniref:FAD-dependent oxidoreductase n=1 Tax=Phaeobacter italicus TaxID=481446 RepID=UPI000669E6AA|nr:FAD-dependent oxidoreductase [Phaeobacter italicus]NKX70965.1 FAD-dependent oxidoreductase [Rhodobacteraceae bacterium R_SAG1]GLO73063.1 FAD-dependent oxidoreductase [Phaeobacter italicus]CRL14849.1 3-(3-hydroxy-phenyl)propionate/3-hydroxycinnamic acid hydroxylase [Phaeobacter italicus]SFH06746.1 3-(3-hydroxy-phenyl)propionate hydroxylase [Phaeobacter italicus]
MNKIFEIPLYSYQRSDDQDASSPVRHPVVVIGAGPVGLAAAIDLAQQGVGVVVLDDNDKVSFGSRAICFSKRTLEIADRLGLGDPLVDKGVQWNLGKVFFDDRKVYEFNLLPEEGHKRPAFINLQQYYFEEYMVQRVRDLQEQGAPIEIRGRNKVSAIGTHDDHVTLEIDTPEGSYNLEADWLIACDGAGSPTRQMLGLDFVGRVFEDNFLIADVIMEADFPTERWFWFDPPFNKGQSALLHKQPDGVWRIDLQLGWDIDKEREKRPENVIPRIREMLGEDVKFELEWVSIYTFQCRRMEKFRHGRVIFAGDAAHQVSPFGARGANSGLQDTDNLCWKLKLVLDGQADESLLDTYDVERIHGADENILNSSRSTDFITPKSEMSRVLRDAVLDLSEQYEFARPLVNSGRLSLPCTYEGSPLNSADALNGPERSAPGSPCPDAPLGDGYLLPQLADRFTLLTINADAPDSFEEAGITVHRLALSTQDDKTRALRERYLGDNDSAVYLIRPDQHVAARRPSFDDSQFRAALRRAIGKEHSA